MSALIAPALVLGATYLLWVFFLAVMCLKRAKDAGQLTRVTWALGMPVLAIGYLLDAFVNVTLMTLVFCEIPQETTVTARLKRHNAGEGWRKSVAAWFVPILDPFDPSGRHIT